MARRDGQITVCQARRRRPWTFPSWPAPEPAIYGRTGGRGTAQYWDLCPKEEPRRRWRKCCTAGQPYPRRSATKAVSVPYKEVQSEPLGPERHGRV
jgi:hypothetical protein